jgi:hypothetical protein
LCSAQHAITIFTCVFKGKNGWLANILKRFFRVPNARSTVVLSCEWRRLNNSFGFSGSLVPLYSLR